MLPLRKLLVTGLLAWTFIVGPLLAIAAGIALFSSISSTIAKRLEKAGNHRTAKTAEDIKPSHDREPIGIRQQLEHLGTTLALLKPVPVLVPAGEDTSTYLRDAIVWQFDSTACKTVVGSKQVLSGIVAAECDSGERFLLIATALTGNRSVLRCAALPREAIEAAPGCK
jgi:hypothetical protein